MLGFLRAGSRSLDLPHAQRPTTSRQRPDRWPPRCVDEGRVGHNPARTYGAIAVELRVFPPLILSLNLSHRVLPLSWAFHIFHQNFTRDKESRHWVCQPCFRPPPTACTPTPSRWWLRHITVSSRRDGVGRHLLASKRQKGPSARVQRRVARVDIAL